MTKVASRTGSVLSRPSLRAIARAGAWLLPSEPAFDVLRILAANTLLAMFLLYLGCFSVVPGSFGYELWADALVGGSSAAGNLALDWRDVGYPLILVASGFPWTHSFVGLAVMATCMGIALPVLVYFCLQPWFPRAAYWAAMASIVSLAPLIFIKLVHHDQPYIFFMLLALWSFNRFHAGRRPAQLYGLALSVFAMSLIRMIGQGMYPPLLLLAWLQARAHPRHFIGSALLFAALTTAYSSYRAHALNTAESVLGHQVFQNIYLHSAEYGVALSPDTGPSTARLIEHVHDLLLPSPAQSGAVTAFAARFDAAFARERFTDFTADELLKRFFREPNWEYLLFIFEQTDDRLLLMACWEIALRNPGYVISFTFINAFRLLYDPGHAAIPLAANPFARERLAFPLSGPLGGYGYNVYDEAPEPALTEARFLPLFRQPPVVRNIYFAIDQTWRDLYHPVHKVLFGLMLVTWLSTAVGVIAKATRAPALTGLSRLFLSDRVIAATSGVSLLLLLNVGLTALLVDPLYRYAHSLLLLQVMLAVVGGAVLVHIVRNVVPGLARAGAPAAPPRPRSHRHVAVAATVLAAAVLAGFAAWAWSVRTVATAVPADGTIHVVSAGGNCGDGHRDTWQQVHSSCSGLKQCDYAFDRRTVRDPGPSCRQNFQVQWTCTEGGQTLAATWAPPPEHNTLLRIACP